MNCSCHRSRCPRCAGSVCPYRVHCFWVGEPRGSSKVDTIRALIDHCCTSPLCSPVEPDSGRHVCVEIRLFCVDIVLVYMFMYICSVKAERVVLHRRVLDRRWRLGCRPRTVADEVKYVAALRLWLAFVIFDSSLPSLDCKCRLPGLKPLWGLVGWIAAHTCPDEVRDSAAATLGLQGGLCHSAHRPV